MDPMVKRGVGVRVLPLSGGVLARMAELSDGSARVETWNGSAWIPGGADAFEVITSPLATPEEIAAAGAS